MENKTPAVTTIGIIAISAALILAVVVLVNATTGPSQESQMQEAWSKTSEHDQITICTGHFIDVEDEAYMIEVMVDDAGVEPVDPTEEEAEEFLDSNC